MVPQEGFEPPTSYAWNSCSTIELCERMLIKQLFESFFNHLGILLTNCSDNRIRTCINSAWKSCPTVERCRNGSDGRTWTCDLLIMSQTSTPTAPRRDIIFIKMTGLELLCHAYPVGETELSQGFSCSLTSTKNCHCTMSIKWLLFYPLSYTIVGNIKHLTNTYKRIFFQQIKKFFFGRSFNNSLINTTTYFRTKLVITCLFFTRQTTI